VQPADLPAPEIDVRLGASWLPPSDVQQFTHELLGVPSGVEVGHNRGIAGELLLRRAEKIKARLGEDIRIGTFAGFDLFIRSSFNNSAELVLRGKNSYSIRVTDTALGTIRSLESVVQGFEERAGRLDTDIRDSQKRGSNSKPRWAHPSRKRNGITTWPDASRKSRNSLTSPRIRPPTSLKPLKTPRPSSKRSSLIKMKPSNPNAPGE